MIARAAATTGPTGIVDTGKGSAAHGAVLTDGATRDAVTTAPIAIGDGMIGTAATAAATTGSLSPREPVEAAPIRP